jgi:hypothetical protein
MKPETNMNFPITSRRVVFTALALSCLASACHDAPTAPSSSALSVGGGGGAATPTATYSATLSASPSCSDALPPDARVRHFVAGLYQNGSMRWTSATVTEPPGHRQVSSAQFSGDQLAMNIGTPQDPQSDAFNGITDVLGTSGIVNISGAGSGVVRNGQISGTLQGVFSFYGPPNSQGMVTGVYCAAADHTFMLSTLSNASSWTVEGVVLDADSSQPIAGAGVEWMGLAELWGDRGHGVTTDGAGKFRMVVSNLGGPGADARLIWMRATSRGYAEHQQEVALEMMGVTTVNFLLQRTPS